MRDREQNDPPIAESPQRSAPSFMPTVIPTLKLSALANADAVLVRAAH